MNIFFWELCINILLASMATFDDFSEEVLIMILSYVDVRTLSTIVPCVNKKLDNLVHDELLWKYICNVDCAIVSRTAPVWRQTLYQNYCKHFLSLDHAALKVKFTDKLRAHLSNTALCSDIAPGCTTTHKDDLWVCLHANCQFYGCGRYKNKHALIHAQSFKDDDKALHAFSVKWASLDFWCYHCMRFVGLKTAKETRDRDRLRRLIRDPTNENHAKLLLNP